MFLGTFWVRTKPPSLANDLLGIIRGPHVICVCGIFRLSNFLPVPAMPVKSPPQSGSGGGLKSPVQLTPNTRARHEEAEKLRLLDVSNPSIRSVNLPPSSWPMDAPVLSLVDRNFNTWDRHLETVLGCYGSLADHLAPSYVSPDPALFPTSANNWRMNDRTVRSFMSARLDESEMDFVREYRTKPTAELYAALHKRHTQLGPVSQVARVKEALSLQFSHQTPLADTITLIKRANESIWAMGPLDTDTFLSLLLIRALSDHFPNLAVAITSRLADVSPSQPYSSTHIIQRIQYEAVSENPLDARPHDAVPTHTALVAQSNRLSSSTSSTGSSRPPEKCSNCKLTGHALPYCNKPGGGMAGKSLEECRAKRKADRAASRGGHSSYASAAPAVAPSAHVAEEALVTFETASIASIFDASVSHTMTAGDISEYEALLVVEGDSDYASGVLIHEVLTFSKRKRSPPSRHLLGC